MTSVHITSPSPPLTVPHPYHLQTFTSPIAPWLLLDKPSQPSKTKHFQALCLRSNPTSGVGKRCGCLPAQRKPSLWLSLVAWSDHRYDGVLLSLPHQKTGLALTALLYHYLSPSSYEISSSSSLTCRSFDFYQFGLFYTFIWTLSGFRD